MSLVAESWIDPLTGETREEPYVWTPQAVRDLMARTHRAMLQTQDEIARCSHSFKASELQAWRTFRDSWAKFYRENANTWDTLWQATPANTIAMSNELLSWRKLVQQRGCQRAVDLPRSPKPPEAPSPWDSAAKVGGTVAVLAGVLVAWRVLQDRK